MDTHGKRFSVFLNSAWSRISYMIRLKASEWNLYTSSLYICVVSV